MQLFDLENKSIKYWIGRWPLMKLELKVQICSIKSTELLEKIEESEDTQVSTFGGCSLKLICF